MGISTASENLPPFYMDADRAAGVDVFVAQKGAFEAQWLGDSLQGRPAICTLKGAIRLWPQAPGHGNQVLRYYLKPKGLDPVIAGTPHRALPDAYVTAFLLRELLEVATVEDLIGWTEEPVLLPRVNFGQHRGCAWDAVPLSYLEWVADRSELNDDIRFSARHHRRLRLGQVMAR